MTPQPGEALREAAQEVVRRAEFDDNFEGEYVDFLVPADALERLRAALAVPVAGETREPPAVKVKGKVNVKGNGKGDGKVNGDGKGSARPLAPEGATALTDEDYLPPFLRVVSVS